MLSDQLSIVAEPNRVNMDIARLSNLHFKYNIYTSIMDTSRFADFPKDSSMRHSMKKEADLNSVTGSQDPPQQSQRNLDVSLNSSFA